MYLLSISYLPDTLYRLSCLEVGSELSLGNFPRQYAWVLPLENKEGESKMKQRGS